MPDDPQDFDLSIAARLAAHVDTYIQRRKRRPSRVVVDGGTFQRLQEQAKTTIITGNQMMELDHGRPYVKRVPVYGNDRVPRGHVVIDQELIT